MVARPQQMANLRRNTPPADLAQQMRTLQEIWKREDEQKAKQAKKAEEQKFRASMLRAGEAAFGGIPILGDFVQGAKEGFAIKDFLTNMRERKEKRQEPPMPALKAYAPGARQAAVTASKQKRVAQRAAKVKKTGRTGRLPVMGPLGKPRRVPKLPGKAPARMPKARAAKVPATKTPAKPPQPRRLPAATPSKRAGVARLPVMGPLGKPKRPAKARAAQPAPTKTLAKPVRVPLSAQRTARPTPLSTKTPKVPANPPKSVPSSLHKPKPWVLRSEKTIVGMLNKNKRKRGTPKIAPPKFKAKGTPQQRRQALNHGMGRRVNKALGNVGKRQPSLTGSKMASVATRKGLPKMRPEPAGGMGTSAGRGGPNKTAEAMEKLTEKLDDLTDEVKDLNKHMGKQGSKGQSGASTPTRSGGPTVVTGTRPNHVRPAVSATQPRLPANRPAPIPPT